MKRGEGSAPASGDLAIILPAFNQAAGLRRLLPALASATRTLGIAAAVIVIDDQSTDDTVEVARAHGARVVPQTRPGYGAALLDGFAAAGDYPFVLTVDADWPESLAFLRDVWSARDRADLIVASRYLTGSDPQTPSINRRLSQLMNRVYARALSVPVRDLSSGYRLYHRRTVGSLTTTTADVTVLPEILVRLYAEGYQVAEVPFQFTSHNEARSLTELARFGWSYVKALARLWRLRNSIASADYDHRAHDSAIWLQRYWQRARHRIILEFSADGGRILDVGCGSSRILRDLPGAVGVDVLLRKLRFLRPVHPQVAQASVFALPFPDASFDTVICSEVIEHIPDEPVVLGELSRVLRPGGTLVLGTPDYGRTLWHIIEWAYGRMAPGGYADEHITHFDRRGLERRLDALQYERLDCQYVGFCEMILKARKR